MFAAARFCRRVRAARLGGVQIGAAGRAAIQPVLRKIRPLGSHGDADGCARRHRAGEKMFIDFSGGRIDIVNPLPANAP